MLRSLAAAVLEHGTIVTTTAKAKCLRPYLEKLITKALRADAAASDGERIAGIRRIDRKLKSPVALDALMNVGTRLFAERPGGYTRILKMGFRDGDGAEISVMQLVTEANPLASILEGSLLQAGASLQERYPILKAYCLENRHPSRTVLEQWASYRFPKFALSIDRDEPNRIRTSLRIPASKEWDQETWPILMGQIAPLELALRFFGDSRCLREDQVSVRLLSGADFIALFSKSRDGTELSFRIRLEALKSNRELVIEHQFSNGRPPAFSAALMSPYATLRSARSIETQVVG